MTCGIANKQEICNVTQAATNWCHRTPRFAMPPSSKRLYRAGGARPRACSFDSHQRHVECSDCTADPHKSTGGAADSRERARLCTIEQRIEINRLHHLPSNNLTGCLHSQLKLGRQSTANLGISFAQLQRINLPTQLGIHRIPQVIAGPASPVGSTLLCEADSPSSSVDVQFVELSRCSVSPDGHSILLGKRNFPSGVDSSSSCCF
mmetsp:Transcript_387/g.622  ORF Transcript_387/g.622 Transcript_387/m.622 type:complete len:206 (-) Transcript_387:251-868(-)